MTLTLTSTDLSVGTQNCVFVTACERGRILLWDGKFSVSKGRCLKFEKASLETSTLPLGWERKSIGEWNKTRSASASECISDQVCHIARITFNALAVNLRYGLTTQSQWRRTAPVKQNPKLSNRQAFICLKKQLRSVSKGHWHFLCTSLSEMIFIRARSERTKWRWKMEITHFPPLG